MSELLNNDTINQVKKLGFTSIQSFLPQSNFVSINNRLVNLTKKKKKIYFPTNSTGYLIKFLKLDFKTIFATKMLIQVAKDLKLKEAATEILGQEVKLDTLDCYLNEKSNEEILEWHNDLGFNGINSELNFYSEASATINRRKIKTNFTSRGVKFFIYMTDVSQKNGCLGLIPYSHKIVFSLTQLILEKKIDLNLYWKLEDLRNLVLQKEVKKLLLNTIKEKELEEFLESSKFSMGPTKDTTDFDLALKKNSVVIFNELCVHRGSAPVKTDRLVLRYLYRY